MLILTRNPGQSIQVGDDISLTVTCVSGNQVRIGINAPISVNIVRSELVDRDTDKSMLININEPCES